MRELNLKANSSEQELILSHLQENASDVLADKINKGVYIEKDGKRLLNKKTLDGFMKYALEEARNLAEKNARAACIKDDIVYGWAMHYFEEDSIEGTLYNEDGNEYKTAPKRPTKNQPAKQAKPAKSAQNQQASIFDLINPTLPDKDEQQNQSSAEIADTYEDDYMPSPEEIGEILAEIAEEDHKEAETPQKGSPLYQDYINIQNRYPMDIVAYKLGDFYEVFGENAVVLGNELDLTITGRDCGLDERVSMVGFPYHAADSYFNKIAKKYGVVVVENKDHIRRIPKHVIDRDTGEITEAPENNKLIDKSLLPLLSEILGDFFIVR